MQQRLLQILKLPNTLQPLVSRSQVRLTTAPPCSANFPPACMQPSAVHFSREISRHTMWQAENTSGIWLPCRMVGQQACCQAASSMHDISTSVLCCASILCSLCLQDVGCLRYEASTFLPALRFLSDAGPHAVRVGDLPLERPDDRTWHRTCA